MTDDLAAMLRACESARMVVTAEDVVDAAWLVRWMAPVSDAAPLPAEPAPVPEALPKPVAAEPTPIEQKSPEPLPPVDVAAPPEEAPEPLQESPSETGGELETGGGSVGVHLSGTGRVGAAGREFRAAAAQALPRSLELARALRPLCRRVPSRTRFVLDEAETIRRLDRERVCNPVLRPARERWLRLSLVLDTGTGSDLWRDTAREFRALLACLGAFRDVRTWSLDTSSESPRLTPGRSAAGGVARSPRELIDPTGRTLTIVLSPCIATAWHTGGAAKVLQEWAAHGPVVLMPLLPAYLWPRTSLAAGTEVDFTATAAGQHNVRLDFTRRDAWPGEGKPTGVALPVAVLEPASLRRWAELVAGRAGASAPGFVLDFTPTDLLESEAPTLTAAERVAQFMKSSELARRLARNLAATHIISLPIIRLIRETLLPQAGQPQEAEVLFGGLLRRITAPDATDPRFEFFPGVREALLSVLPRDEGVSVLKAVSAYLNENFGGGRTFSAVLADPTSAAGELVAESSPFAELAAKVLAQAGGDYAKLVRRSPKKAVRVPDPLPVPAPEPPVEPVAEPVPPEVVAEPPQVDQSAAPTEPAIEPIPVAVLEVLTRIDSWNTAGSAPMGPVGDFTKRMLLSPHKTFRLGSDPSFCDWAVPEDRMISRYHVILVWNGVLLTVTRRGVTPEFPHLPQNHIWFNNQPVTTCTVKPGEWFVIGQTRFTLRSVLEDENSSDESGIEEFAPVSGLISDKVAATAFHAVEKLTSDLKLVVNESHLIRRLIKVVMDGLPRVGWAAVVRMVPDLEHAAQRVSVVAQFTRDQEDEYQPEWQLVRQTVRNQKSLFRLVRVPIDPYDDFHPFKPSWDICIPFLDDLEHALCLSARLPTVGASESRSVRALLSEYQRVAAIVVNWFEPVRRALPLLEQNKAIRRAWPQSLWKYVDAPEELERMLVPKELEITTLFCDLREYAAHMSRQIESPLKSQLLVGGVLDERAAIITEQGGEVVGVGGETLLGFWGWPSPHDQFVERAARAAVLMQNRVSPSLQAVRVGIGLTHGPAVVGRLGEHETAVVNAYGPVVELASRLAEVAQAFGVGVVASAEVAHRLGTAEQLRIRLLGRIRLSGFPALNAYEISGTVSWRTLADRFDHFMASWNEAVERFTAGDWENARELLRNVFTSDPAAQCLLRVMDRTGGTPPSDWDGTFTPIPAGE